MGGEVSGWLVRFIVIGSFNLQVDIEVKRTSYMDDFIKHLLSRSSAGID
jgi:hypothetical protein